MHQPYALRAIIQLDTDAGLVGLGETYADDPHLAALHAAAEAIDGRRRVPHREIYRRDRGHRAAGDATPSGLVGQHRGDSTGCSRRSRSPASTSRARRVGRPVSDLLGGAVRDAVPFSAYLFYKWAGASRAPSPTTGARRWTRTASSPRPGGIIDEYGFTAIKLKGGVFPPEEEMAAIEALHEAFPGHPLRLDPNAAWTPQTSVKVACGLAGVLEYLEDPTPGIDGMAEVARQAPMPLATNMCVVAFDHLAPAVPRRTRSRSSSPITTTGAGCGGRGCSPGSATPSASGCRCTPTRTWASAWPRWCTWPARRPT